MFPTNSAAIVQLVVESFLELDRVKSILRINEQLLEEADELFRTMTNDIHSLTTRFNATVEILAAT
jgi:hypothetical protein